MRRTCDGVAGIELVTIVARNGTLSDATFTVTDRWLTQVLNRNTDLVTAFDDVSNVAILNSFFDGLFY
ncbi:hypothetical protein D3C81_1820180 [compost metagenome]